MVAPTCYLTDWNSFAHKVRVVYEKAFFLLTAVHLVLVTPGVGGVVDGEELCNLLWVVLRLHVSLYSQLPFVVSPKSVDLSRVSQDDCVVVPASSLRDPLRPEGLYHLWRISRVVVIMTELAIIVETTRENLTLLSHEDGMVETACRGDYHFRGKALNDLRSNFVGRVLKTQLAIVISPHRIHHCLGPPDGTTHNRSASLSCRGDGL